MSTTDTNKAHVDALAVMQSAIIGNRGWRASLADACFAVAELIEADKEYDITRSAFLSEVTSQDKWDAYCIAANRRDLALANIQGGAA